MNKKSTLVVTATPNPNEQKSVQAYLQGVLPLLMGAGGNPVKRLKVNEVIRGKSTGMVLVMDFDSDEVVTEIFHSDEYAALIPIRDQGFAEMNILLTREM